MHARIELAYQYAVMTLKLPFPSFYTPLPHSTSSAAPLVLPSSIADQIEERLFLEHPLAQGVGVTQGPYTPRQLYF